MHQKTFHQEIRGEKWKLVMLSQKKFAKLHSDIPDATGVTDVEKRMIYFNAAHFSLYHVIHELVHAKFKVMCLADADINADQMEEIFAKYMGDYGEAHIDLAKKIYRRLASTAKRIAKHDVSQNESAH